MALVLKNRVKEETTTTGTGAFALGGASAQFDTFQTYMSNGDTTYYSIAPTTAGTDEWEIGIGTWNTGNTLSRTTVLAGSNGTSAVNFSAGTKEIFMTYPADKAIFKDGGDRLNLTAAGTSNNPSFSIDTTTSGTYVHSQENFAANLTQGQTNVIVVGKEGSTKNSGYVGYTWTGAGSNDNFVTLGHWGHDDLLRIYGDGSIRSGTNYKSAGWNWVTTPYHYYVATTSQSSVTVAVNSGFTTNGNSAIPSSAKALYVTYYYHVSGYSLGDGGQGDHAQDIWGPDAPATTTSWSFTTSGNYDWGSAVFMHDGDASESGDIGYYGIWHAGAIIPVNANGNIYGLLAHGWSGGTHYHHMYVWGYAL